MSLKEASVRRLLLLQGYLMSDKATREIVYKPIGTIRTSFQNVEGMPIQPLGAEGTKGSVELFPEYTEGLHDIEGYSHLILIYHFHLSKGASLLVKPFLDDKLRGVFATRAPKRPNSIGFSVVRLTSVNQNRLEIEDADIVDGTPLLDIKPFVSDFDNRYDTKTGWMTGKQLQARAKRSDERFSAK
jgi:tRNA (adenine37-N6)-methyltransferase